MTETTPKILVLQTGKMREKYISNGVDYLANASKDDGEQYINSDVVVHRFLPHDLEAKYEALDFVRKFGLEGQPHFSIFDASDGNLSILPGSTPYFSFSRFGASTSLLDRVNVVVAVGSTSLQAFKITNDRVIQILPISDINRDDPMVLGNREDPNLTAENMASISCSQCPDVALSVLRHIRANTVIQGREGFTNAVFVNQIGYSILGFNPRGVGTQPHVPSTAQKVVSMRDYEHFTTNRGKTALIEVFQNILKTNDELKETNNMFLVARQCKAFGYDGTEHDISGQWANQAIDIVNEPSLLLPENDYYDTVIDLGGSSGTSYSLKMPPFGGWIPFMGRSEYNRDKYFMNTPSKMDFMKEPDQCPNNLSGCIDAFTAEFNRQLEEVFEDLSNDVFT